MKHIRKISASVCIAACLFAFAPSASHADCSSPDLDAFGACIKSATTSCAADSENCSLSKDLAVTSDTQIVDKALTKCCNLHGKKAHKACLVEQRANVRREQILLPSSLKSVKTLLGHSQAELGELIAETNVCATFSVE